MLQYRPFVVFLQLKNKQNEAERKEEILAQLHERYSAVKAANPNAEPDNREQSAAGKPRWLDASRGSLEIKVRPSHKS